MDEKLRQFLDTKALLRVEKSGAPTTRDLQVSTVVLLMKMAHVDGNTNSEEFQSTVRSVARQFEVRDEQAAELIEIADFLRRDKHEIDDFIELINERFEDSQKVTVCAMLWKVMIADGVVSSAEAQLATEIVDKLSITNEQIEKAKLLVEAGEV